MPSVAEVSFTCERYLQHSASVPEVSITCDRYLQHLASVAEVSYTCVRYLQHAHGQYARETCFLRAVSCESLAPALSGCIHLR